MTIPRKSTSKTGHLKRSKLENLFHHANAYWAAQRSTGSRSERGLRTSDYNLAVTLLPETLKELKGASETVMPIPSPGPSKPKLTGKIPI